MSVRNHIQDSVNLKKLLCDDENFVATLERVIKLLADCLRNGNKVLIAGNGGSAADAHHFAAELVGEYKRQRKGYPAIALTTNPSILTALGNDFNFESVFSRQVEALGKPGDVFVAISTSGDSKNVINAISRAKELGLGTVCLLGRDGGRLKDAGDINIIIPSSHTPLIQEVHIMLIHSICEEVEGLLLTLA